MSVSIRWRVTRGFIRLCLLAGLVFGCQSESPKDSGPPPLPPPPPSQPPLGAVADVAGDTVSDDALEAAFSLVLSDEYTAESVNPWQATDLEKDTARFALTSPGDAFTPARLALERGQKPDPSTVSIDAFINHFLWPVPTHGKALGVVADALASPFKDGHAFVRVSVQALAPEALIQREPLNIAVVSLLGLDEDPTLSRELLRALGDRWWRGALDERGDTLALLDAREGSLEGPVRLHDRDALLPLIASDVQDDVETLDPATLLSHALDGDHRKLIIVIAGRAEVPESWRQVLETPGPDITLAVLALADDAPALPDARRFAVAHIDDAERALDALLSLDPVLDVAVHDASTFVRWNPAAVKRYRLLGFENHAALKPSVSARPLRRGQGLTAVFEVELRDDPQGLLASAEVSYAMQPGGAAQTIKAEVSSLLPVVPEKAPADAEDDPDYNDGEDLRFAVAVAVFAELLRASPHARQWALETIAPLATAAAGEDPARLAFVALIERALPLFPPPDNNLVADHRKAPRPRRALPTTRIKPDDAAKIKETLSRKKSDIADCIKRIKMQHGHVSGAVAVDFVVERSGKVRSARVVLDDIGHGLDRCVTAKIRRWSFPSLSETVKFRRPWTF